MKPGDLIIGKAGLPVYVVFIILSVTRNGWLKVQHHSDQEGKRVVGGFVCKFRKNDMVPFQQNNPSTGRDNAAKQ